MTFLAFESPVAAGRAATHSPSRAFEMTRVTRRTPAPAPIAAAIAPSAPATAAATSPSSDDAPERWCLCGELHTGPYEPRWSCVENTRLVEVFCEPDMRDAVSRLGSGRTREAMDANLEDPWVAIANRYNMPAYKPDNAFPPSHPHHAELATMEPGNIRLMHSRPPHKLKKSFSDLKRQLTSVTNNYEKSGQNNPDKTENDFTGGDVSLLYCWLRLDDVGLLEDFGTRRLPGDAGAEDGSPPLVLDDDAPVTDAPPTAHAAPAAAPQPKRRRSDAARTAKHVLPAAAAPEGATMDQVLQGLLVNSLANITSIARPPPPPPPPQHDAKTTEEEKTVEMCIGLLNSNISEEQKAAVVARTLDVIDRRVARCNPSTTSAGDDEF